MCKSGWGRMSLWSRHPTHMDHNGPSLRNICVFSIPGPVCNSGWWRMYLSSSHPTHMDYYGPSLRNRPVFSIPPPEGHCATLSSGECPYHPATLHIWTIKDLVWEIDVSSKWYLKEVYQGKGTPTCLHHVRNLVKDTDLSILSKGFMAIALQCFIQKN